MEIILLNRIRGIFCLASFTVVLLFLGSGLYGQMKTDPESEEYDPAFHCSMHKTHSAGNHPESVTNPNPLMFKYDVKFYKLDIEATNTSSQFSGYAIVYAEVLSEPMDTFSIELHNKLEADSTFIDGIMQGFDHSLNNLSISLDTPIEPGEAFEFKLFYHTPPAYSSNYYSSTVNPVYGNFPVSQSFSEPYSAHEWMPCKQELDDKADSVHIFITTDTSLMAAGPGLLTQVLLPDGKIRHEWRCNIPAAYYLIAFAVSDYTEYTVYAKPDNLPGDSIPIQNFVFDYPGCLESNKPAIDNTVSMIELLSTLYSIYPFHQEKYGHYMWYPSGFSGMEHITMSGMRYFNTYLVSHELGHSWFGNNVTCATWSDIWINEGFATYTQYLVLENLYSKAAADAQMESYMNYVMAQPGGSVYVPPDDLGNTGRIFNTRLSYRKGGALVHMIRYIMQDDSLFFKTLQDFQDQFHGSVATGLDFKSVCESVSGIDFTGFFNEWYFGEGFPTYDVVWSQLADTLKLEVEQSTSSSATPLFSNPMEYRVTWDNGDTTFRFDQSTSDTVYSVFLPYEIISVVPDPNNWVLNGMGSIVHRKNLQVKVFLEGPFNESTALMNTCLNPDFLPLNQPYDTPPWNYPGAENFSVAPPDAVDWVLVEIHDASAANLVSSGSLVHRKAGLLLKNGQVMDAGGSDFLQFDGVIENGLFLLLVQRNHLDILSANSLPYSKGVYTYDFSLDGETVFGGTGACKELLPGTWGMTAGDGDGNGTIDLNDITGTWQQDAGRKGYTRGDFNLDGECNNPDKNDRWLQNGGTPPEIPE